MYKVSLSFLLRSTPVFLLALMSTGCGGLLGSASYHDVKYYALSAPRALPKRGIRINVLSIKSLVATKNKMLYRDSSCLVLQDEYNKWIQSPVFMMRQYLQDAFNANDRDGTFGNKNSYYLSGSIVAFEINLVQKTVTLGMDYRLQEANNREICLENAVTIDEPYRAETPAAFAEAMSTAAAKLSQPIFDSAWQLHRQNQTAAAAQTAPAAKAAPATKAPATGTGKR
ncbi:MAG: ABC-type transport auxiliary lipoprotein family protein [Victivallales bacterium]|nr:ABC-type transport auxiliary lipoprotein family protein [Victivallales bacterium]